MPPYIYHQQQILIHSKIMTETKFSHHLEYYRNIQPTVRLNSVFHRHVLKVFHLYFLSTTPLLDYKITK